MRYFVLILAILILEVFQAGVLLSLGIWAAGNLALLLVLVAVMFSDFRESLFVALAAGVTLDFISGTLDGTVTISVLVCFAFTYFFINRLVHKESTWMVVASAVVINTLIYSLTFLIINHIFAAWNLDTAVSWSTVIGWKLLKDLLINLIFIYPVYLLYTIIPKLKTAH